MKDPALARPWGTGSIEPRGERYIARYRDHDGKQRARVFGSIEAAGRHLDEVYASGRWTRPVPVAGLRELITRWHEAAGMPVPGEAAGVYWECADELEAMIDGRGWKQA